jgi:hypothetical protein
VCTGVQGDYCSDMAKFPVIQYEILGGLRTTFTTRVYSAISVGRIQYGCVSPNTYSGAVNIQYKQPHLMNISRRGNRREKEGEFHHHHQNPTLRAGSWSINVRPKWQSLEVFQLQRIPETEFRGREHGAVPYRSPGHKKIDTRQVYQCTSRHVSSASFCCYCMDMAKIYHRSETRSANFYSIAGKPHEWERHNS